MSNAGIRRLSQRKVNRTRSSLAKEFHHAVAGDLSLTFETMELSAESGLTMFAYTAEPGSKSEEALNPLASWAAAVDQVEPAHATGGA